MSKIKSGRPIFALILAVLAVVVAGTPRTAQAQEFDCNVSVDYDELSGSEYTFLDELGRQLREYINDRDWIDDRFMEYERIGCNVQIRFQEAASMTDFTAQLSITMRRPIYNTTQSTTVLKIKDPQWQFSYTEGQPLTYEPERYDPLTSLIDFYVYVMLGYDYDTFSEMGGTPYFEQARSIAERARSQASGWTQVGDDRGRYSLIQQLLNPRLQPLRQAYFNYHFGGLDHFVKDPEAARTTAIEVLRNVQKLYENVSRQYVLDLFFTAKSDELVSLFQESEYSSEAYSILTQVNPSGPNYERLVQ